MSLCDVGDVTTRRVCTCVHVRSDIRLDFAMIFHIKPKLVCTLHYILLIDVIYVIIKAFYSRRVAIKPDESAFPKARIAEEARLVTIAFS